MVPPMTPLPKRSMESKTDISLCGLPSSYECPVPRDILSTTYKLGSKGLNLESESRRLRLSPNYVPVALVQTGPFSRGATDRND